jgi:hypothetical protein
MIVAMTTAFRRSKRFVKQTPILWTLFSKARAVASSIHRS